MIKILKFFNLLDRAEKISITNLCVYVIVIKIAVSAFDWPTAAGLLVTMLNYDSKRRVSAKADQSNVKDLESKVNDILKVTDKIQSLEKLSDEVQKIISTHKLGQAFVPRGNK